MEEQNASMSLSEGSNQSVETNTSVDNSASGNEYSQEDIAKALEEPTVEANDTTKAEVEDNPPAPSEPEDNTPATEYPVKFQNKDGSLDTEKLLKSYKELEPLLVERSKWEKERAEFLQKEQQQKEAQEAEAREAGFESVVDMEQFNQLANIEANEFAKYLHTTDDPETVRKALIEYIRDPKGNAALIDDIMLEFPPSVVAAVAVAKDRAKQGFAREKATYEQTAKLTNIENVIAQSVNSENGDLFEHTPFRNLFERTLQKFGDSFTYEDAQLLMGTIEQLKESWIQEYVKQSGVATQNKEATDKLASITTNNSAPAASQARSLDSLSSSELAKEIRKYI